MPFKAADILRSKFLVAWGQTAVVICFGAAALAYGYNFGLGRTVALVIFSVLMSLVSVSYGLAFDTTFPSFTWENPNAINRGVRMIIPFLSGVGTLILCAAVLGVTRILYHGIAGLEVGLGACALMTFVVVSRALHTSRAKIEVLEV